MTKPPKDEDDHFDLGDFNFVDISAMIVEDEEAEGANFPVDKTDDFKNKPAPGEKFTDDSNLRYRQPCPETSDFEGVFPHRNSLPPRSCSASIYRPDGIPQCRTPLGSSYGRKAPTAPSLTVPTERKRIFPLRAKAQVF